MDPVVTLQQAMQNLGALLNVVGTQLARVAEQLTKNTATIQSGLTQQLEKLAANQAKAANPALAKSGGGQIGSSNPLSAVMDAATGVKNAAFGMINQVKDLTLGTLQQFSSLIDPFVSALNPALMAAINRAFRDLNAVIGVVAQEAAAMFAPVVRGIADMLLPAMQAFQPVMAMMMSSMEAVIQPLVNLFGQLMEAMLPLQKQFTEGISTFVEPLRLVAQVLAGLLGAIAPLLSAFGAFQKLVMTIISGALTMLLAVLMPLLIPLQVLGTILSTVIDLFMDIITSALEPIQEIMKFFTGLLNDLMRVVQVLMRTFQAVVKAIGEALMGALGMDSSGLKDMAKNLQDGFRSLLKTILLVTAQFMQMLGLKSGIKGMLEAIKGKRKDSTGLAVAEAPQFKAISDLGKDIAQQAFVASGEGPKAKKTDDWLEGIAGDLEKMLNGGKVETLLDTLPKKLAEAIVEALAGKAKDTILPNPGSRGDGLMTGMGLGGLRSALRGGR